jgi:hypothetical protein
VLLFVDADVVVHGDTLRRVLDAFDADAGLGALFGAYDDAPAHPSFLSQYRNLLHRYVHLRGAGQADTFWAGCGAVRTDAFVEVGGFDAARFPRPQIEDIELGYRLRDAGHRIEIRPEVQAKHLKRWTFAGMLRTDLLDRGVPWMGLLLERRSGAGDGRNLNVGRLEKLKTGLVGLGLLMAAIGRGDAERPHPPVVRPAQGLELCPARPPRPSSLSRGERAGGGDRRGAPPGRAEGRDVVRKPSPRRASISPVQTSEREDS